MWLCIRLNKAGKYCDGFFKKSIFADEAHFDLGGYVNKQNCRIWGTENPQAYIESRRSQNESLFGVDFGPQV